MKIADATAALSIPVTAPKVSAALPFVIPSELRISYFAALKNDHVCGFL